MIVNILQILSFFPLTSLENFESKDIQSTTYFLTEIRLRTTIRTRDKPIDTFIFMFSTKFQGERRTVSIQCRHTSFSSMEFEQDNQIHHVDYLSEHIYNKQEGN